MRVTFWTFLWQVRQSGKFLRDAVRKVMAWFCLPGPLQGQGGYQPVLSGPCSAAKEVLERVLQAIAQGVEQRVPSIWRFHGREVKVGGPALLSRRRIPRKPAEPFLSRPTRPRVCGFPLLKLVGCSPWPAALCSPCHRQQTHLRTGTLSPDLGINSKKAISSWPTGSFCDFVHHYLALASRSR